MRQEIIEVGEDAYLDEDQKILKRLRKGSSRPASGSDPFLDTEELSIEA